MTSTSCCVCLLTGGENSSVLLELHDTQGDAANQHLACLDCMMRWAAVKEQGGQAVSCPLCRESIPARTFEVIQEARGGGNTAGGTGNGGNGNRSAFDAWFDGAEALAGGLREAVSSFAADLSSALSTAFVGAGLGSSATAEAEEEDMAYIAAVVAATEIEDALRAQRVEGALAEMTAGDSEAAERTDQAAFGFALPPSATSSSSPAFFAPLDLASALATLLRS